ncbi:MAG: hypothetical protein KF752_07495 [Pirellulaceae bacterium]|nr:hypothetical protein [Pirellulaceae bacterium]
MLVCGAGGAELGEVLSTTLPESTDVLQFGQPPLVTTAPEQGHDEAHAVAQPPQVLAWQWLARTT